MKIELFVLEKIGIDFHHISYYLKSKYHFDKQYFIEKFSTKLSFLPSEFRGQLPKAYSSLENATRLKDPHFNDANKEETDRYVRFFFHD